MQLLNANVKAKAVGVNRTQGIVNYLVGKDRRKWHVGIPMFTKIQYAQIYPGIDLVYYGNQRQLEYDFVVRPGADPRTISLGFQGIKTASLLQTGDVAVELDGGKITLNKPGVYQMIRGKRRNVDGRYTFHGSQAIGIEVGLYDRNQPLIIDPVLVYSTYLGGSGSNEGIFGLAVDGEGNAYTAGFTDSSDFPTTGSSISAAPNGNVLSFVSKLNASGTGLIYSTYLGGSGGDWPSGLAVDANGYAYVVGYTASNDFPVTNNAFQTTLGAGATANAFLSKLSADGQSLLYSTYVGGGAADWAIAVAVDAGQDAYISSRRPLVPLW